MTFNNKSRILELYKAAQVTEKKDWNYYLEKSKDVRKKDVADGFQIFWPFFATEYRGITDGSYDSFRALYSQLLVRKGRPKFTGEEIVKIYAEAINSGAINGFFIEKYPQLRTYLLFLKTPNSSSFIQKEGKEFYVNNFAKALGWDLSTGKKVTLNSSSLLWLNDSINRFKKDAGGNIGSYEPDKVSP